MTRQLGSSTRSGHRLPLGLLALLCVSACGTDDSPQATADSGESLSESDADTGSPPVVLTTDAAWKCSFSNPFSLEAECKDYTGEGWTEELAREDCAVGQYDEPGEFQSGSCALTPVLGACDVPSFYDKEYRLHLGGDNADFCSTTARACVGFLQGYFMPSELCSSRDVPTEPIALTDFVFEWPTQTCRPPVEGDPAGTGPDGDVCTWSLISGCTEEGRDYLEYGDCDIVRTNRPYYSLTGREIAGADDPRHSDEEYLAESDWVRTQVESCACVCCHTDRAPDGPAKWNVDAGALWTDTMSDTALALFAGYVDSSALGAFEPEANNGFNRLDSALPTTDVERMHAFFRNEFDRREIDEEWARSIRPIGGPLVSQAAFVPEPCPQGSGVGQNGELNWEAATDARYIYVLEVGARNPGIPPNFDVPEGTIWRVDVPSDGVPIASGSLVYGEPGLGSFQRVPANGPPSALDPGVTYYLYVLRDVAVPIERCLFVAPGPE